MNMIKILLVEDNTLFQRAFEIFLHDSLDPFPISVLFTKGISSAEKALEQESPQLALLDGMVEDGMGYDLIPRLKEKNPAMIIVMCSSDEVNNLEGEKRGATFSILKASLTHEFGLRHHLSEILRERVLRAA